MASPTILAMDGDNPTPAADAVFQTAELVENILLSLPLKELLPAQKVCKFFKACIEGSINAQIVLFCRSARPGLLRLRNTGARSEDQDVLDDYGIGHDTSYYTKNGRRVTPVINPFMRRFVVVQWMNTTPVLILQRVSPDWDESEYLSGPDEGWDEAPVARSFGLNHQEQLSTLRSKGASWRRMLFLQPACEVLKVKCNKTNQVFTITNSDGITAQDFLDGVRRHWFDCPTCPFDRKFRHRARKGHGKDDATYADVNPIGEASCWLHSLNTR
ncbi:hypothetical protein PRZ48_014936 [Zasmidium cellare]|uniref:F-box domain-containing protein n=1 Tax=Zasmidium cellare TaxID=395010 RepID=A0ABR0DXR4_ZASCE|nr:hypothetical protein PRZ48_014936 [Zasmidium cellare]